MHSGELELHRQLGVPAELSAQMPRWPETAMDAGRQLFFKELPYFALGTLDATDRPWATCFVGQIACEPNRMTFASNLLSAADPVRASLLESAPGRPWAGVGLDYSNRRRNKVEGRVERAQAAPFVASLFVDKTLGNCPKYINTRRLVRVAPTVDARTVRGRGALPAEAIAVVERADTLFLASRHLASNTMDVNHRGGPSGFVRTTLGGAQIVIPDFSGNRIFSSLGNIRADGCAGVCVPDFVTGDVLYVTGAARVLIGEAALNVMPRCNVVVVLDVDEFIFVAGGLALRQEGDLTPSPYNPLVRKLRNELGAVLQSERSSELVFVSATSLSPTVVTFRFRAPALRDRPLPGQFATIDCSSLRAPPVYKHMDPANPQSLSDDFVRTWTISGMRDDELDITVKLKPGGAVSPLLHEQRNGLRGLRLLGFGGEFVARDVPERVWLAAGSGVTPFMAMLPTLTASSRVSMLFVVREADSALATPFAASPHVQLNLFVSDGCGGRRPSAGDVPVRPGATYWLCGPPDFLRAMRDALDAAGVPPDAVLSEKYDF